MSRSSTATDGPWKNCSTDRPSVATRDVSRTLSAPSAAVHWFGPGADQLEQPRRRLDAEVPLERSLHGVGNVVELVERRPERTGELREPHQRAEVAGRERRAALLLDRLDVDARRAAAADDDDRPDSLLSQPVEHLGREPLRVPVADDEDGVALAHRQAVEGGVHRLDGPASTPASRNSQTAWFAACQLVPVPTTTRTGGRASRSACASTGAGVGEQGAQVVGLAPDRGAHDARHSADPAGCSERPRPRPGAGVALPPAGIAGAR